MQARVDTHCCLWMIGENWKQAKFQTIGDDYIHHDTAIRQNMMYKTTTDDYLAMWKMWTTW